METPARGGTHHHGLRVGTRPAVCRSRGIIASPQARDIILTGRWQQSCSRLAFPRCPKRMWTSRRHTICSGRSRSHRASVRPSRSSRATVALVLLAISLASLASYPRHW